MIEKLSPEQIRRYWTAQAERHGPSPDASWSDTMAIQLEINEIVRRLSDGQRVLDVGCANGYSTLRFARARRLSIRGVDFIPEMVEKARASLAHAELAEGSEVEFAVGDALALEEPSGTYDVVTVIRALINLSTWDRQRVALKESARVLRPGGILLLSEATFQGWSRLNQFRAEWGLPDVPMPAFNQYLDQEEVCDAAGPELTVEEIADFSSTYFVGTRVLKPLLIEALGKSIDVADPNMEWNRWFASLPAWGDYGTQKLFVMRRN